MQPAVFSSTSSRQLCFPPWKSDEFPRKPISLNLIIKSPSKTLTLTRSLTTSINYGPEEDVDNTGPPEPGPKTGPISPAKLPVVVRKSGRVSRYTWDGSRLNLESVDGGGGGAAMCFEDGFRQLFRISGLALRNVFIPKRVTENYMQYVKWKLLHRVFSSALQVLATQAMFRAIGIGFSRSLPSAAAFNWVLKDGLGRLSRCIYTASLASAFDTNLKRVRFSTSVMFSLSIGVEMLTPVFPQYFLLLATVANIAKQISLACYLATSSAVHRSFAVAGNLGEVSAKAQIQSVCFDSLGLLLAAILNLSFKNNPKLLTSLPFLVYPFFAAVDVFGIYQGLKHVHLQTLTKIYTSNIVQDRLEIILDTWIRSGCVPSPEEPGFFLCLREGAGTADVTKGLLQACYIRRALLLSSRWVIAAIESSPSDLVVREWCKLLDDTKVAAERSLNLLDDQMAELGWARKNILLSSGEQARYSFIDD
ncbi:unnamed protein product [Linum tenue]|uniref:Protein root UVB sensitive/RUS domain-containing protein n=1 Tax=Linum tenue TaxID=586396 RepID=A0AAV0LBP0_9ROSI|nr:unnamed protein product [Linum tenue]